MSRVGLRPGSPAWQSAWTLLALVLALTAYRIWLVDRSGITLFVDEAQYWDWSRHLDWGYYSKPPVVAWLIAACTAVLGDGVLGVKAAGWLCYGLMAGVLYAWVKDMLDASSAWWVAVMGLCMPLVAGLSLFVSTDAPLMLCWSLAAWLLWRAQRDDRWPDWLLLGWFAGLGVMSKYTMAAFALTALWALWALPGKRKGLFRVGPWLALAVVVLCVLPNVWWNMQNGWPTLRHTEEITLGEQAAGGWRSLLEFSVGQMALLGPVAAWLVWRAWRVAATSASNAFNVQPSVPVVRRYAVALSLPLLCLAGWQALTAKAHINWAAPAHIGLLLLAVLGARSYQPSARVLTLACVSSLLMMGVVWHMQDLARLLGKPAPAKSDIFVRMRGWDAVLAQMKNLHPAGMPVATDSRVWAAQVAYHWRNEGLAPYAWNPAGQMNSYYQMHTDLNEQTGRDVMLLTESSSADTFAPYAHRMQALGHVSVTTAPNRQLVLYAWVLRGFKGY
jgi:4-amino-4-deoxy-L-arabinose transferase-like glycosyltransferase